MGLSWKHMQKLDVISLEGLPEKYWDGLPPEKVALALALALPRGFRPSMPDLAKQLGCTPMSLWRWKNEDEVQELVRVLIRKHFFEDIPDIMEAMKNRAVNGDTRAAEIFLGYVDRWFPRGSTTNHFNGPVQINITAEETEARVAELMRKTESHEADQPAEQP